jgi:transposase-like protein
MLDNILFAHPRTKTDLSIQRKRDLVDSAYSLAMNHRSERIREALDFWLSQKQGRTVLQLCKSIGITEPTLYNWLKKENDHKQIFSGNLMKFSKATGFHPTYLETNRKPKMLAEDAAFEALLQDILDFSHDEIGEMRSYASFVKSKRARSASGER